MNLSQKPKEIMGVKVKINTISVVLFFLLTLLVGCSGIHTKYGMNSYQRFKVSKEGNYIIPASMSASGPYSSLNFEGVAKVSNAKVNSRIFEDSSFLAYARDVEAYIDSGSDSAILFYRNYVTSCCDGLSVGSFWVYLGYHQGKLEPAHSFITEAGSISPPHYTWWPRKIISKDSSVYIEAYENPKDTAKPFWFEIRHNGVTEKGLDNFSKSKRELRSKIGEKLDLVKSGEFIR